MKHGLEKVIQGCGTVILPVSHHGLEAHATSQLTLKCSMKQRRKEIVQAATAGSLLGLQGANFSHTGGEFALKGYRRQGNLDLPHLLVIQPLT